MGEDITIQENGVDLCNAAVCELSISITNVRAGKPLGTTTTVTEQGGALVALPRMATETIGPDGGSITIQGATISIPAGALATDTELTFEALTAADINDQDVANYEIPTTFLKLTARHNILTTSYRNDLLLPQCQKIQPSILRLMIILSGKNSPTKSPSIRTRLCSKYTVSVTTLALMQHLMMYPNFLLVG